MVRKQDICFSGQNTFQTLNNENFHRGKKLKFILWCSCPFNYKFSIFKWRIFVIKCCYSNCNIIYQKAEKHVFFLIQTIKNPFIEIAPVCNIWLDQRFDLYIRCGGRYSTLNIYLTCITTIAFYPEVDNLTFIVCKKMHLL